MGTTDRFSRREFQRILDVTEKQLSYWEKLRLLAPRKKGVEKSYAFQHVNTFRTAKQLIETGVSAQRLHGATTEVDDELSPVNARYIELRIRSNGRDGV